MDRSSGNGSDGQTSSDSMSPFSPAETKVERAVPDLTLGGSAFPPIADYGFLSDCETVALVAPTGNVEWLCLPRVDSPSVFGAMLDRSAGYFRLGPAGVNVPSSRRYLPGTLVLETSWATGAGWIIVRDVLLMGPWHHDRERSHTHRRAPTDYDAEHVLLRTVRCVNGEVEVLLDCEPAFDYGRTRTKWEYDDGGYREGVARWEEQGIELRLTTDLNLGFEGPRATARHRMKEGEQIYCALSWSEHPAPRDFDEAYHRLVWTAHHWQHWLDRGDFPDHPWRAYLQRSALTLKGLTYTPTGALLAAATTSLPEAPHGERNWDYRYSWIRDATFMLWALYTLGFDWEANDFFYFIADVADGEEDLQVMYGVGGERELDEHVLDHMSGYEGARPVRVGNDAYKQEQHDVWGALLDSVYLHTRSRDSIDERVWPILVRQVEMAVDNWQKPDRGIWEVRGEPKHFTFSKMSCWVACAARGVGARRRVARGRGRDPRRCVRARRRLARRVRAALRHGRARRLAPAGAADPVPAAGRRAHPQHRPRDCRRADRGRAGPALPHRGDRRRTLRRGGQLHDLLVPAGLGALRDRRPRPRPRPVRATARVLEPARPVRRGARREDGSPPRQLPPGVHPLGTDQRRHPRDPR
jgi:GH15 family glucan-1,4-alpha-glucosidase